jgi:hypothetical protein
MTERRRRRIPLEKTEEPGVFFDPFKQRYTVILYHPETESRYFFGDYRTREKAIAVRNAERDTGGYKTTRSPRSWDKLQTAPDAEKDGEGCNPPPPR